MDGYHSSVRADVAPLVPRGRRLLDVGGGTGETALHLKSAGVADEVGVIDAVAPLGGELAFASRANLDDRAAVEAFLAAHGPFDTILFLDVLEHLVDPWAAVEAFTQALAPGGAIVASVPNIRYFKATMNLVLHDRWTYTDSGILDRTHLRFFVRRTAIELFERAGLAVQTVRPSPISGRKYRLFNALTFGAFRSFLTLQYFIVARRAG
jgi:2-polyprenyl-3-methyl-5-hydroxy-6-metoxy-1,4-benzoquinol methylase